eukprot:TRINITY_DN80543_c0_g1_i1.p1 TRINITY_DN80543_c0_g1~~TRINITY_DN80543_c0_g1_i1.p1  ORF type:complete len:511 (-),score=136.14 TRINITY_DN80543_c0_g1_i1:15-1547(-)
MAEELSRQESSNGAVGGNAAIVDTGVWQVVARCPALLKQAENGLIALAEVSQVLASVATAQSAYGQTVIKSLAKRARALEAALSVEASSVNRALHKLKDSTVKEAAAFELEGKYLGENTVPAIQKIIESKSKIRQTLLAEQDRKKRELDTQKETLDKRRKDCVKQHTYLHELMKKIIEGRQLMMKENDAGKREKVSQSVEKVEKTLFNHKMVVRKMFADLEKFCAQVNEQARVFYEVDTVVFMERIRALEIEKNDEVKAVLEKYVQYSKHTTEQLLNSKAVLDESISAIFSSQDASMYAEAPIPAQWESAPAAFKPDLPCRSDDVEKQADGILKAGMAMKMTSKDADSASNPPSLHSSGSFANLLAQGGNPAPVASAPSTSSSVTSLFFSKNIASVFGMSSEEKKFEDPSQSQASVGSMADLPSPSQLEPPASQPAPVSPEGSPSTTKGFRVVAIFDYTSENPSEYLSLKEGDVVVVTDSTTDSYWWAGYLENDSTKTELWFPVEYVDYI